MDNTDKPSIRAFWIATGLFVISFINFFFKSGVFATSVPFDKIASEDSVSYLLSAKTLIETGRFTYFNPEVPSVFMMPGAVFAIAPFIITLGFKFAIPAFKIFQCILQILNIYLVGKIAAKTFRRKTSTISMIVYALYLPCSAFTTYLYTETLFTLSVLLLVYFTIIVLDEYSLKNWGAVALIWGLSCLMRPTIAIYPLIIVIMFFVKKYSWKQMASVTILTSIIFSAVMAPWWIRNAITFERFIPLTNSSGNPMWLGSNPNINLDQQILEGNYDNMVLNYAKDEMSENSRELELAKENIRSYFHDDFTGAFFWFTLGKSMLQWSTPFISVTAYAENIAFETYWAVALHLAIISGCILFVVMETIKKRKRRKKNTNRIFIYTLILVFQSAHLPYYASARHMYPLMGLAIILGVEGIIRFWKMNKKSFTPHTNLETTTVFKGVE